MDDAPTEGGLPPSLFAALPVGLWVLRVPDFTNVLANEAALRITGTRPRRVADVATAAEHYGIHHPDGRPYARDELPPVRALREGRTVREDVVFHRPDGSRAHVRAIAAPVVVAGRPAYVTLAFFDITEEVNRIAEGAAEKERLFVAVRHAPIALFALDAEGRITVADGAVVELLGHRPEALLGANVFELYGEHPTVPVMLRRGLDGEELSYTVDIGGVVLETWIAPVRGPGGDVTGLIGVSTDVTERRRLAAQVIEGDRYRTVAALAAGVAHEVNNPLAYMAAGLAGLRAELARLRSDLAEAPSTDGLAARLDRLEAGLDPLGEGLARVQATVGELMSLSRPAPAAATPQSLPGAVGAALRLVRGLVESRATLELDLQPVPAVLVPEQRLVQVCLNLLQNAAQALPPDAGGDHRVRVSTRHEGALVLLEVEDSGPGVPDAAREQIFAPFESARLDDGGHGLGLFVSRGIARASGGDLTVHAAPGGGALFRFSLPAHEAR